MLKGENLTYRYDNAPVLVDASIAVAPGEWVGLLGPSGQGKTTLARLLAGYLVPQQGRVTVDGAALPVRGYSPVQLIFQHPELAVNPRWRVDRILHEAYEIEPGQLAALGVEPSWLKRWPHELSGGELQRVCVARALGPRTRYLIADEITAMLDALTQAQIWRTIRAEAGARNIGLLVISHDEALLDRLCSRIVRLDSRPQGVPVP